jgi:hypothetical protein
MFQKTSGNGFRLAFIAALIAPLFSCYSVYVEPAGDDRASLELVNDSPLPIGEQFYRDPVECRDRAQTAKLLPAGERRTVGVTTKGEAAFEISQDISRTLSVFTGCVEAISFHADKTKKYTFTFRQVNGVCSFAFTETGPDGRTKPTVYDKREWIRALDNSGPFCRAKK